MGWPSCAKWMWVVNGWWFCCCLTTKLEGTISCHLLQLKTVWIRMHIEMCTNCNGSMWETNWSFRWETWGGNTFNSQNKRGTKTHHISQLFQNSEAANASVMNEWETRFVLQIIIRWNAGKIDGQNFVRKIDSFSYLECCEHNLFDGSKVAFP